MVQYTDGEYAESEDTLVDIVTAEVCRFLDSKSAVGQFDDSVKQAIALGIHQAVGASLQSFVDTIGSLEPLVCSILHGTG